MSARTDQRSTQLWTGWGDGCMVAEERRLEDHDMIVRSATGTPWLYEPRGPFQYQEFHQSADPLLSKWRIVVTLDAAVNEFARWALPPRRGYAAEIVDESFRQILCGLWSDEPHERHGVSPWGLGGAWFGCRAAFDVMHRQRCCDVVSLAIWEGQAMSTAPGSGYME
jgi:hypothetical protein